MASVSKGSPAENETFLRNASQPDKAHSKKGPVGTGPVAHPRPNPAPHSALAPPEHTKPFQSQLDQWTHFAVLAIQVDSPAVDNVSKALGKAIEALLTEAEKKHQAIWSRWRDGLYGCALPQRKATDALDFGRQLQTRLARKRVETVTIGATQFPLGNFNRHQSLANACKALDHAAFFGPGGFAEFDAVSLNISGDQYYQADQLHAAMGEYQDALGLDPENVNVINSLGVCLARQHNLDDALAAFTRAYELDPQEAMAIYNAGMIRLLQNRHREALALFEKAAALDSQTFDIAFQTGRLLTEQGQWDKARPHLERAVSLNDTCASAYCLLGDCLAALEQRDEAFSAYTKSVKLNPNDATALSALGMLYSAKGENPEICVTFCRQSVALEPENGLFRDRLAHLYLGQEQWEAALSEFERASALGRDCQAQIAQVRRHLQSPPHSNKRCA